MNLFVTVGTQLPFDRMVRAVDEWAGANPHAKVFAQVGPSRFRPRHCRFRDFVDADECHQRTCAADLVVAHAGMGSIITALELARPLIIMPRRAALGEHRSEHQMATVRRLAGRIGLDIALDESRLRELLERRMAAMAQPASATRSAAAQLIGRIRCFIHESHVSIATPQPVALGLDAEPIAVAAGNAVLSVSRITSAVAP